MTGSIKDYTPNFNLIIPEFNITGWHDYLEENFRSIDAMFYNLFGINNYKGQWKNSTVYNAEDVVFIGDDTSYSGRLVKVLVQHTTAGTGNFTEFFTSNPNYYELFADASTAQLYAQEAKDWAVKLDGPVEDDLYSSKFYANIVNGLSTEITTLYNIKSDIQNVSLIGTEIVEVSNIKNSVQNVANNSANINTVADNISSINNVSDNINTINSVNTNISDIQVVENNIIAVNSVATNITNINAVNSNKNNINSVADNATNINNVAGNTTNINKVANNTTNINTTVENISDINTNATNINSINTNASNISVIQSAYSNAQSALNSKNLAQEWATSENLVNNTDYSAKHYAEIASHYENPLRIGQIVESTIPLTDAGLHLLDGSVISGNGIYKAFYDYIGSLVNTYPQIFCQEHEWQAEVARHGVCGKFVFYAPNMTVRLPKISGFIEGTNSLSDLSMLTQAGVPNITATGTIGTIGSHTAPTISGAFVNLRNGGVGSDEPNTTGWLYDLDASKSNSIYGKSSTVQPQSIKVLRYICIATSTKTDIQVDIDKIVTNLNGKANIDLSNCTKPHIVETYVNGPSWYRVYSDGWCEQGANNQTSNTNGGYTVTFLKPFKNTNYNVTGMAVDCAGGTQCVKYTGKSAASISFYTTNNTQYSSMQFNWQACGYIS